MQIDALFAFEILAIFAIAAVAILLLFSYAMQTNVRLVFRLLAAFAVVAVCGFLFLLFQPISRVGPLGIQTKSLSNARQLAIACKLYAADHQDRLPMHLSELDPDYITDIKSLACSIRGPSKNAIGTTDWLYFGVGFTESNPPRVLIASPQASTIGKEQKRIVVFGDVAGAMETEEKYQEQLAETVRQMHALDESRHTPSASPAEGASK